MVPTLAFLRTLHIQCGAARFDSPLGIRVEASSVETRKRTPLAEMVLAIAALVAAICSVFFIDWETEAIDSPFALSRREHPRKERTHRRVGLAFCEMALLEGSKG